MKKYNHVVQAIASNADLFDGDPASDVINMKGHNHIQFLLEKGAGAVGTATITVEACDDVVPTTTEAIPFRYQKVTSGDTHGALTAAAATGFTTTAGANQIYKIEVDAEELNDSGYNYIRLQITEVADGAVNGGVQAIMTEAKTNRAQQSSVLT